MGGERKKEGGRRGDLDDNVVGGKRCDRTLRNFK